MIDNIVTLAAAGILGLAGAYIGRDAPSKKTQCIESYSACITAGQPQERCNLILETVCKKKIKLKEVEDDEAL